jgi:hypothetical protein
LSYRDLHPSKNRRVGQANSPFAHYGDHRRVKQRLVPMLGLKSFRTAAVVISGIELEEKIKKNQFKFGKLGGPTAAMPEIWRAPSPRDHINPFNHHPTRRIAAAFPNLHQSLPAQIPQGRKDRAA